MLVTKLPNHLSKGHRVAVQSRHRALRSPQHLEDLPGWCNTVVGDALSELTRMDERINQYDKYIAQAANEDAQSRQLMQLSGIGPTTASAIVATIGKGHDFTCGRQFCAWLGLVPGQYSSGGKQFLRLVLQHVLPKGFRRARNYGFLHPNSKRLIALLRLLVFKPCSKAPAQLAPATQTQRPKLLCRGCGVAMTIVRRRILPVMTPPACPNQEGVASI